MQRQDRTTASTGAVLGFALALVAPALAGDYQTRVVAAGLSSPTGIAVRGSGTVYFTEIPNPGVAGAGNGVRVLNLDSGAVRSVSDGEPEPVNLALAPNGTLYWTCKSAGVILERRPNGHLGLFLQGLTEPNGIGADDRGNIFFTMLPTPGVKGSDGGTNTVNVSDGVNTTVLTTGEPEPTDIVVAPNGDAYWTCKSAGVILRRSPAGVVSLLLSNLDHPVGIALDHQGRKLYWTQVPTPGIAGSQGGSNSVEELDLVSMARSTVNFGDPEPTDVAVARNGNVFWTCTSAGVIVEAERVGGRR
jgi:sugar lactone lactonase YvrE